MPTRTETRSLAAAIVTLLAAILFWLFASRFVAVEFFLLRLGPPLIVAAFGALALIGTGFMARTSAARLLKVEPPVSWPALDLILGYPLFGSLCFLVGLVNISSATMGALLLLGAIAGGYARWRRRADRDGNDETGQVLTLVPLLAIGAITVVLAMAFVEAQAPAVSLDELAYHLAVPRIWTNEGHVVTLPLLSHSFFPFGIESADLPALSLLPSFTAGIASHFLHVAAMLATIALLLRWLRRRVSGATAWLAAAAIVTTPALAVIGGWSLDDWPLVGIAVALTLGLDGTMRRREPDEAESIDVATVACALAGGMLTKYTFLALAGIALAVVLWLVRRDRAVLRALALAIALGAVAGSVFFVHNLIVAHDPLAPLLAADAPDVGGFREGGGVVGYLFDSAFFDEALGVSLIALAIGAAATRRAGRKMKWIAVAQLAFSILMLVLMPSSRILLPFLIVAALAGATALEEATPILRRTLAAILLLGIAMQTLLIVMYIDSTQAISTLTLRMSDDEFMLKQRPLISSVAWIDSKLPSHSRTLVLGCNQLFLFGHAVRGGGNFDAARLSRYLDVPTPEALFERFRRDGITHVAVIAAPQPRTADERKLAERSTVLTPLAQRALADTLDHYATSVVSQGNATLFTLK